MKKTIWIVRTAVCLALLLVLQVATKSLGQFVTGSCVNLVLAMAALTGGVWSGVIVAVISPFCAYALGIGPAFLLFVPCVALGNAVYAVLFALLVGRFLTAQHLTAWGCMALAAAAKGLALYLVLVKLVAPTVVPAAKLAAVTAAAAGYGPDWRRACLPACAGRKKGAGEAELIENSSGAVVTAPFFENNRFPRAA